MPRTRVHVTNGELYTFRQSWPCSGLPRGTGITFEYGSDGGLVDITLDSGESSRDYDGPALLALSHDAQQGRIGRTV